MGTNKDRTAGNRTTVRLSNGYALSSHVNAVATVWGVRVLFLGSTAKYAGGHGGHAGRLWRLWLV